MRPIEEIKDRLFCVGVVTKLQEMFGQLADHCLTVAAQTNNAAFVE